MRKKSLYPIFLLSWLALGFFLAGCVTRKGPPAPVSMGSPVSSTYSGNGEKKQGSFIIVKPGDSVGLLARRYHVSASEIIALNHLKQPFGLRVGQRLFLPGSQTEASINHTIDGGKKHHFPTTPPKSGQIVAIPLSDRQTPSITDHGGSTGQDNKADILTKTATPGKESSIPAYVQEHGTIPGPIHQMVGKEGKNDRAQEKNRSLTPPVQKDPGIEKLTVPESSSLQTARDGKKRDGFSKVKAETVTKEEVRPQKESLRNSENISSTTRKIGTEKFAWPVRGKILKSFGKEGAGFQNDGINIEGKEGDPIQCVEDGIVAYVGNELQGFGNLVMVKHSNGWMSAYAHCSEALVKRGEKVVRGKTIARVGRTGSVRTPQLHFELRKKTKAVDPMPYLE